MRWSGIAYEAGNEQAVLAASWFEDSSALIDECYARTAQAFAEALLRGETAPRYRAGQGGGLPGRGARVAT